MYFIEYDDKLISYNFQVLQLLFNNFKKTSKLITIINYPKIIHTNRTITIR